MIKKPITPENWDEYVQEEERKWLKTWEWREINGERVFGPPRVVILTVKLKEIE